MKTKSRARHAPASSHTPSSLRNRRLTVDAHAQRERIERLRANFSRTTSNVGVYERVPPYSGPKQFELYHPSVVEQLQAGATLRGRPPVAFVVTRNERLFLPYGGFHVSWRGVEVGRHLSYPDYSACRRLREHARAHADSKEVRELLASA